MNLLGRIEFPNLFDRDLNIDRVAFNLFGINIYWYGIIITAAVALGIFYALKRANVVGVLPDNIFDVAFWGFITGILGARIYYVIFWNLNPENLEKYDIVRTFTGFRDGGLAVYGGLIGALIGAVLAAHILKIRFIPILDLVGAGFLIGHSLGRWGNFVNQEAFGAPTAGDLPWGMTGDVIIKHLSEAGMDTNALVHPCFLYESLWCALGLLLVHFYIKKFRSFDGEVFLLYLFWYGAGRAFIEGLRTDSLMLGDSNLRVSQVLAIASAVFALMLFAYFKFTLTAKKGYVLYKNSDESKQTVENHRYNIRLNREKEDAKKVLKRLQKENRNNGENS